MPVASARIRNLSCCSSSYLPAEAANSETTTTTTTKRKREAVKALQQKARPKYSPEKKGNGQGNLRLGQSASGQHAGWTAVAAAAAAAAHRRARGGRSVQEAQPRAPGHRFALMELLEICVPCSSLRLLSAQPGNHSIAKSSTATPGLRRHRGSSISEVHTYCRGFGNEGQ
eukprot:XP_008680904.1 uncharacterized protein LOC103656034 [Zea mays]